MLARVSRQHLYLWNFYLVFNIHIIYPPFEASCCCIPVVQLESQLYSQCCEFVEISAEAKALFWLLQFI